ncbi:FtsK/SpoIIIE domain-containing protein [Plantactinospora sp. B5E13]|uniref:FtsK/SpoIIIE domain-containing protein n=1 Tax=Plantactinospora sp. B5E13 TaxID=3153758 RepID=UPI00325C8548
MHRQAAATTAAAATVLETFRPAPAGQAHQHELAERLRSAASRLTPGWLGAPLDAQSEDTPLGGPGLPTYVRIGVAQPLDDARFPAVVPLLGTGHLTVDADSRDPRVAGLLRAVLLRLLAAAPAGSLLVRGVDAATEGELFAPFALLADAGLMPPPVTDRTGLRAVLAEAEQWVRPARPTASRHQRHDRTLLLVIGSLPELTEGIDLARIGALAREGPEAGLHLLVAGWPPPPLTEETTQPPLPRSTMVAVRNPYALVGDPPGGSFTAPGATPPPSGLNAPVFLDEAPPPALLDRVCRELAARLAADYRRTLADLLPDPAEKLWAESVTDGLSTPVGHDGDRTVILGFDERTPHWLVGGRAAAGKSGFLVNVLYGLGTRYHPDDLAMYLVDFADGAAFDEFVPAERGPAPEAAGFLPESDEPSTTDDDRDRPWLPHVRAVGVQADREYGLALLRDLDAELDRRTGTGTAPAESPPAGNPVEAAAGAGLPPRILCVLDEFPVLLAGDDEVATEALRRLESVARRGRAAGVHLILSSRPTPALAALRDRRESFLGQFPVRVALPGGTDVLEPANDSAAGLPLGTAVVNTAGGLGGPRGATRGHERVVRFPDPHVAEGVLDGLRQRLWAERPPSAPAPAVFTGYLTPARPDEPPAAQPPSGDAPPPAGSAALARMGRVVEVRPRLAAVEFGPVPGRHLAVFGPAGADLLDTAARDLAAQHQPGAARFVVAALVEQGTAVADALRADLAGRHPVEQVDSAGLTAALDRSEPGYLVVFGMDGWDAGTLPPGRLPAVLRDGPARGSHLLSWWRTTARFVDQLAAPTGPGEAADEPGAAPDHEPETGPLVDNLVFVDVPEREVGLVLGRRVPWRPRTGRALHHDLRTDSATLFVPFAPPPRRRTP